MIINLDMINYLDDRGFLTIQINLSTTIPFKMNGELTSYLIDSKVVLDMEFGPPSLI